jgi:hypothetical protein
MTFNRVMKVAHTDQARVPSFDVDASTACPWCGAAIHHAPGTSAPSASSEDRRDGRLAAADGIDGTVGVSGEAIPHQPIEEPWVYTVEEAAERLRIGRTLAYQLAGQYESSRGRHGLPVIRLSNCLRVPRWALLDLARMGRVVSVFELAAQTDRRRRSIRRRITVRRAVREAGAAGRRPRSPGSRPVRRLARSPGGGGGSVEQLVLVPGD